MRVLGLALAAALALAAPAQAVPILEEADATDLGEQLAEARERTGVCFGWAVQVDAFDGSAGGLDSGGDDGAGCERALRLTGTVTYASELSESEDAADLRVEATGFPQPLYAAPTALTGRGADDLLGDEDDKALFELAAALPLLAAELDPSLATRLPPVEPGTAAEGAEVGSAGSDWAREHGTQAALGAVLLLGAAFLLLTGRRPKGTSRWTTS